MSSKGQKSDLDWAVLTFPELHDESFKSVDVFKRALRSLTSSIGLVTDDELTQYWATNSDGGEMTFPIFRKVHDLQRKKFKQRASRGMKNNTMNFNTFCSDSNPFEVLRAEGVAVDLKGLQKILGEQGEPMAAAEFYDALKGCETFRIEEYIKNGKFKEAEAGLRNAIDSSMPTAASTGGA